MKFSEHDEVNRVFTIKRYLQNREPGGCVGRALIQNKATVGKTKSYSYFCAEGNRFYCICLLLVLAPRTQDLIASCYTV